MSAKRRPQGAEAQCTRFDRFFGSTSAFDLHLTPHGCTDPAEVRAGKGRRAGEPLLKLVERKRGPTWVGAGEYRPGA